MEKFSFDEALSLLKEYNTEPFHIEHAKTVSKVMGYFANEMGYEAEREHWELVGLLHDIDYGKFPDEHCQKAPEILKEIGASDEFIKSVVSHGFGLCSDVFPDHPMEKVLFAVDELTGLIGAAARMRPTGISDMELKSLKKKFKDKSFAAGCSREVISKGAEYMEIQLDELLQRTLDAMKA